MHLDSAQSGDHRERFMQALLAHAPDVISILDRDATIVYESPAAERAFGVPLDGLIGQNAFTFVHPDDIGGVLATFQRVLETPGAYPPITFRLRHSDGSWRWFEVVHNNCMHDPAVAGIVVNLRDITDRMEAQDQLRTVNTLLRSVVQASPFAIVASDLAGTILVWNPAAERMWGWSAAEMLGRSAASVDARLGSAIGGIVQGVLAGGIPTRVEMVHTRRTGEEMEVSIAAVPMRDAAGYAQGVVWFSEDITEQNRIALRLREQREMELALSRLEIQLAQTQLQVLQTQLHPHFLFNTLSSIAVLMHQDRDEADRMIVRLADLLRLILRRSAAQSVTLQEELDFLDAYLEIEQARYGERLRVVTEVDPEACPVLVPHLILQPLVENAVRHGIGPLRRPGLLEIRGRVRGEALELEVRDNGRGLPAGWSPETTGVGIANTRRRLEQLYGPEHRIHIGPNPGGGVVVHLTLPARTAPA